MTTGEAIDTLAIKLNLDEEAYQCNLEHGGKKDSFTEDVIEALGKAIKALKNSKRDTDDIFLLSDEEYEKYKDEIPHINSCWWLRSPGYYSCNAAYVDYDGSVDAGGDSVSTFGASVRPALNFTNLKTKITPSKKGEDYFMFNEVRWKVINKEESLAIAEMPISFSKFDDKSNDYEHSHIRKWLLAWLEGAEG